MLPADQDGVLLLPCLAVFATASVLHASLTTCDGRLKQLESWRLEMPPALCQSLYRMLSLTCLADPGRGAEPAVLQGRSAWRSSVLIGAWPEAKDTRP